MTKWTIPSPAIERLTAKIKQQERQIETQAATIATLRRKLTHQERANTALQARIGLQQVRRCQQDELPAQTPAEWPGEASGGDT